MKIKNWEKRNWQTVQELNNSENYQKKSKNEKTLKTENGTLFFGFWWKKLCLAHRKNIFWGLKFC